MIEPLMSGDGDDPVDACGAFDAPLRPEDLSGDGELLAFWTSPDPLLGPGELARARRLNPILAPSAAVLQAIREKWGVVGAVDSDAFASSLRAAQWRGGLMITGVIDFATARTLYRAAPPAEGERLPFSESRKRRRRVLKPGFPPWEDTDQKRLKRYLDERSTPWFHPASEGRSSVGQAMRMKAMGKKPGLPDDILVEPCLMPAHRVMRAIFGRQSRQPMHPAGQRLSGCVIELKRARLPDGSRRYPVPAQKAWLLAYWNAGHWSSPAWGFDQAVAIVEALYPHPDDPLRVMPPGITATVDQVEAWATHEARERWRWSHAEIARRLGVSSSLVSKVSR